VIAAVPSTTAGSETRTPNNDELGTGMSASDAQQSIAKGGSLKDRIAALQGLQLDQPGLPGRPARPWKKKELSPPEAATDNQKKVEDAETNVERAEPEPTADVSKASSTEATEENAPPKVTGGVSDTPTPQSSIGETPDKDSEIHPPPPEQSKASEEEVRPQPSVPQRIAMPAVPRRTGPPRRKPPTPSPAKEKTLDAAVSPADAVGSNPTGTTNETSTEEQPAPAIVTSTSAGDPSQEAVVGTTDEGAKLPDVPYSPSSVSIDPSEEETPAIMTQHPSARLDGDGCATTTEEDKAVLDSLETAPALAETLRQPPDTSTISEPSLAIGEPVEEEQISKDPETKEKLGR
jgi:hypothetical protein